MITGILINHLDNTAYGDSTPRHCLGEVTASGKYYFGLNKIDFSVELLPDEITELNKLCERVDARFRSTLADSAAA